MASSTPATLQLFNPSCFFSINFLCLVGFSPLLALVYVSTLYFGGRLRWEYHRIVIERCLMLPDIF
ncbi:hypothetical protein BDZ45DRAFT_388915 [Acephala macrosclerotiorum]|nr:hypothetical protein BDZ45DRAFT_388915 [Acephala macrosclerotiorum]